MATAANRAARNREARQRLDAAFAALGERLGVAIPPEPKRMKDPGLQPIVEIERFAGFAEAVLAALDQEPAGDEAPRSYDMTVAQLKAALTERGVVVPGKAKKADLVALMEADDADQGDDGEPDGAEDEDPDGAADGDDAPPAEDNAGDGEPEGDDQP